MKKSDQFYTESLNSEEEAKIRKKKSEELKRAIKGRRKVQEVEIKKEPELIPQENERESSLSFTRKTNGVKGETPSIFTSARKKNGTELNLDIPIESPLVIKENEEENQLGEINNFNNFNEKEIVEEIEEDHNKEKEDKISSLPININANLEKEITKNITSPVVNETDLHIDVFEMSKIYYYAEMLEKFIGADAEMLELKSEDAFIKIIQDELEKILSKEDYKYINGIYKISSARTKYSNIMAELHKDKSFSEYIEKQSNLFVQQRPYRVKAINWMPLFNANYESRAWLENQDYAKNSNESLTPWTKTGAVVWLIGLLIGGLASYFNYYNDSGQNPLNMMAPLVMIFGILLTVAVCDGVSNMLLKRRYQMLKDLLVNIKNSVNDIVINKGDTNPLMFDVCSVYIKSKIASNQKEKNTKN